MPLGEVISGVSFYPPDEKGLVEEGAIARFEEVYVLLACGVEGGRHPMHDD